MSVYTSSLANHADVLTALLSKYKVSKAVVSVWNCGTYFLFLRLKRNPESLLFTLCKRLESAGSFLSQSFLCSSESGNTFSFVTHIVLASRSSRSIGIIFLYSIRTVENPLFRTGPHEDVAKLYLMEQTKTEEISQQVAAFLRWVFHLPVGSS